MSEPAPEPDPASDEATKEARQPFQFTLTTLLAITAACAVCLTLAMLSADPIVLPAMLGAVLLRAIFTQGPRRKIQIYVSAAVGAMVTLLACLAGWNSKVLDPDVIIPNGTSFSEFIFNVAPLNAVRSYAGSGVLTFFLCYQMLNQPAKSSEQIAQRLSTLVVMVVASVIVATIMGCEHFPIADHH